MAASGTKSGPADMLTVDTFFSVNSNNSVLIPSCVYFGDQSIGYCRKATFGVTYRKTKKNSGISSFHNLNSKYWNLYPSSSLQEESLQENYTSKGYENSTSSTVLSETNLKLESGSCYLPHPEKLKTGGEDAHFIFQEQQVIGVADGVGGWAEVGVDAGIYARELMSNSVSAIREETKGLVDPAKVLEKAHSKTKEKGSSTACIVALRRECLHAINLGDSGFVVIRDGKIMFESPVQQHGFNFTYQLENSKTGDQPSSGQVFVIPVVPGDVVIAGSDGLFDNLFNNEITEVVVEGLSRGLGPEEMAKKIADLARERALDRRKQSPFALAAQEAGYRYFGGKLDDTTVVVSFITSSTTPGRIKMLPRFERDSNCK